MPRAPWGEAFGDPRRDGGLAPRPAGLALGGESARTLPKVFALQHGPDLFVVTADRRGEARGIEARQRSLFRRSHGERRTLEDLLRPAPRRREEFAVGDDLVDEA